MLHRLLGFFVLLLALRQFRHAVINWPLCQAEVEHFQHFGSLGRKASTCEAWAAVSATK